ncbi:MAG: hypothetical protein KGQ69_07920 [Rhodospirillales bacterium]|nr:hypothetical protein [Rhodospirillales bacterium]
MPWGRYKLFVQNWTLSSKLGPATIFTMAGRFIWTWPSAILAANSGDPALYGAGVARLV